MIGAGFLFGELSGYCACVLVPSFQITVALPLGAISMRWHRAWKVAGLKSPTLSSVVRVRR